jgi:hypothetical protein
MRIRVGALAGRFGCVEMIRSLTIKIVLSCRLSIDVLVFSVYGHHFSGWRIVAYLRYTRLEATARDTFSLHGWPHNLRIGAPPSP